MSVGTELAIQGQQKLDYVMQLAENVADSRLYPGIETPQQSFTLMMLCDSKGLNPMQALERYHIIKGRPSMRADAMQAEYQNAGGIVVWVRSDAEACEARFVHPTHAPAPGVTIHESLASLKERGVTTDMHRKYPAQMLRARVISQGVRMVLPGIIMGIYTPEEFDVIDVTGEEVVSPRAAVAPTVRASVVPPAEAAPKSPPAEMSSRAAVNAAFGGQGESPRYPVKEKVQLFAQRINSKGLDARPWNTIPSDEVEALNNAVKAKCQAESIGEFEAVGIHQVVNHLVGAVIAADPAAEEHFTDPKGDKRVRRGPGKLMVELAHYYADSWRDWLRSELKAYLDRKRADAFDRIANEVHGDAALDDAAADSQEPATPPEHQTQEVLEPEVVGAGLGDAYEG